MKTISDLNNRIWYRLTKVCYFFILIGLLGFGISDFYESYTYYPLDYTQTRITCQEILPYSFDIKKSTYNIKETLTIKQKNTIAEELCGKKNVKITENSNGRRLLMSSNNVFSASEGVMVQKIHLLKFLWHLILVMLGLGILTELLRRTIYYIFLKSMNPKK